jgi:hypothetical protein
MADLLAPLTVSHRHFSTDFKIKNFSMIFQEFSNVFFPGFWWLFGEITARFC